MALAGSCAGGIAGIVGNPFELIMVRMQADKKKYGYRNSLQAFFKMTRDEGPKSWFRGVVPNGIRSILMNASQLGSYDWFKNALLGSGVSDGPILHFFASLGAVSTARNPLVAS